MYDRVYFDIPINNVYVCGDIHGNFNVIKNKISEYDIRDSVIIVAGDCGFGFEKPDHYKNIYNKIRKVLIEKNTMLLFIRGNHDSPEYFNGDLKISYNYFKTISDYSVLTFKKTEYDIEENKQYNILCVGGAISIDRINRISKDSNNKKNKYVKNNQKKTYWDNESPVYNPDILNKIREDGIEINYMIAHTSPNFAPLLTKTNIEKYLMNDKMLNDDLDNERLVMTKIYEHIIKDNHPLELYVYGHFHSHIISYSPENIKFVMLDCVIIRNNSWDYIQLKR